jgi:plasmid maintenance system antidote protein VapI
MVKALQETHPLLDAIIKEFNLKHDAALAQFLKIAPSMVSKIRHRTLSVTGDTILRVYDRTGWSIEKIREKL